LILLQSLERERVLVGRGSDQAGTQKLADSLLELANGRNRVVVRIRCADNPIEGRLSLPFGITDR